MALPNALRALGPAWFRFTDPEDAGKYGDQWFVYDESKILRLRAKELIALETDLGMPLVAAMNGFRDSTILGDTAAAWIGVRQVDMARAGNFDDFNIISMLIEWTRNNPETGPKDSGEPETSPERPDSVSPTDPTLENTTSGPTDTVVLPV